jgi:hypothetical protein
VPPSGSSLNASTDERARRVANSTCAAKPPNSCPSRTGVASCRWVRPILSTSSNSAALRASCSWSTPSAGSSCSPIASMTPIWMAVGMTSLDDWQRLTWSFGWTGDLSPRAPPSISLARPAMTSFAFMLVDVPDPVWNTSTGKWASSVPSTTSVAAATIASATRGSSSPSSTLVRAAARLTRPMA